MKVFDVTKTIELTEYDLSAGKLVADKRIVAHYNAVDAVPEKTVAQIAGEITAEGGKVVEVAKGKKYRVLKEYPNGGRRVEEIVAIPATPAREAYDEFEDILVYVPYTAEELENISQQNIRARRAAVCFPIINRGILWYDTLTAEQRAELAVWYQAWLDAPAVGIIPSTPDWVKDI